MRSEQEMLDLILTTAREDERVRAVILNGSRANPNAWRDFFQDFDIVYIVTDAASFRRDLNWPRRFGELMILQMPEDMRDPPAREDEPFSFLMQFTDGNRIDLWIVPLANLHEFIRDSLSVLLLDKDNRIGRLPPASERDYLPRPPAAKQFSDCCNEFWWVSAYVAKGLWRDQIIYARTLFDQVLRDQLMKMATWYIGMKTGFACNPGGYGKHFREYLEPELWELLLNTYSDASPENTWEALFTMGSLFRRLAVPVAQHFGFEYPYGDDERVSAHLRHVRSLPKDATEMY